MGMWGTESTDSQGPTGDLQRFATKSGIKKTVGKGQGWSNQPGSCVISVLQTKAELIRERRRLTVPGLVWQCGSHGIVVARCLGGQFRISEHPTRRFRRKQACHVGKKRIITEECDEVQQVSRWLTLGKFDGRRQEELANWSWSGVERGEISSRQIRTPSSSGVR